MKKRIIALVLVVVMSLLALVSCTGGYDFIEDDLNNYVSFDYDAFKAALQKIEIEDEDFTTDPAIREKKTKAAMYSAIAEAIIGASDDEDHVKEGVLSGREVLYFVYYAVNEKTGDVYFRTDMSDAAISSTTSSAPHYIKLDAVDVENEDENKFLKALKENLIKEDIKDYLYSALTADEIKELAEEAYKAENENPTLANIEAAGKAALKVKEGDKIVISYTVSYPETKDGATVVQKKSVSYETVTLTNEDPFLAKFLEKDSVANVGSALEVFDSYDDNGDVKTTKEVKVKVKNDAGEEITYTYTNVTINWKVESEGKAIATFKYTPYSTTKSVTADQLGGKANDLKNVELTYYVFPSYYLSVPTEEELSDGKTILSYVFASKLKNTSGSTLASSAFEILSEEYKNGKETVKELVEEIVKIYDAPEIKTANDKFDNEYYNDGDLRNALIAVHNAQTLVGDKTDAESKAIVADAKAELAKVQMAEAAKVIEKIVAAEKDGKTAGAEVYDEYYKDTFHELEEAYNTKITEKIQKEVWKLIDTMVVFKNPAAPEYPEELLDEYWHLIYENYEYLYYNGSDETTKKTYYETYATFEAYLIKTLGVDSADKIDDAIAWEAKAYINPLIKIYTVAKACEADALKVLPDYIKADIASGAYDVDEDAYRETYGDDADEKIAEAKKDAEESKTKALEDADKFLIDAAYMKDYKKTVGNAAYNSYVEEYGEHNLRASFQFNRLFYYLVSTNLEKTEDGGHSHVETAYKTVDGVVYLDFRTLSYKTK